MTRERTGPANSGGPILAGILAAPTAEDVLRYAFEEAYRRALSLRILVAGFGLDHVGDTIALWAEKYPDVAHTMSARPGLDAAITLTAASRDCSLAVVAEPDDAHSAAVLRAAARRVHCPLTVVPHAAKGPRR
ncbi:hypothetical protein HH310_39530 [Actinoplanes sp. TBRC 11911]|uniref:hypothetical protein n=1 Tax=Actinoplanes sp. TBRC 11911 TaxID=2729386 RepID=UPI00145F5E61|nr:hypothetical protein [Actinoplanes sp. TBRC 11911]NMO57253.1 hypothetical protein [Actinoplanes sp. TBRC 11911]